MARNYRDDRDRMFEDEYAGSHYRGDRADEWRTKGARFVRYLSTRKMECWGFFLAGFLIAKIIF